MVALTRSHSKHYGMPILTVLRQWLWCIFHIPLEFVFHIEDLTRMVISYEVEDN